MSEPSLEIKLPINYEKAHWTLRKLAREQYVINQNGLCHYCKNNLNDPPSREVRIVEINTRLFPPNFFKYPIHLHHDHKTGMTIGAMHNKCNAFLWQYHNK